MIKTRGGKIILYAIITLCVIAFSLSGLAIFNFTNKRAKKTTAADLVIYDLGGLQAFANAVNSGNTFSGKTVVLNNNIDCGGANLSCIGGGSTNSFSGGTTYSFNGNFNGQGYSIHSFNLTGGRRHYRNKIVGQKLYDYYYDYYMALFVDISSTATIQNLKVENYSFTKTKGTDHKTRPTYHTFHLAGLVSNRNSGGSVNSCYVITNGEGGSTYGTSAINNSLLIDGSASSVSGTNLYGSLSNQPPTNLSSISVSSKGGDGVATWYQSHDYHHGWPIPRVFIKRWHEFFPVIWGGNPEGLDFYDKDGNLLPKSKDFNDGRRCIMVPHMDDSAYKTYSSSTDRIIIYDQEIIAKINGKNINFEQFSTVRWHRYDIRTYYMEFVLQTYVVTFDTTLYNSNILSIKSNDLYEGYEVYYGTEITAQFTNYSKDGKYFSSCTFTFMVDDFTTYYTYTIANEKYYISGFKINEGGNNITQNNYKYKVQSDIKIVINTALKTYGVTFE